MRASETLSAALRRLLERAQAEQRLPGAAAAVFRDGEVEWADAVGFADVEAGRPATPDTQFRVGSITKTFTAAAVMQLRDAGRLRLDDALGSLLPDAGHAGPTVRHLLSHLSGIQREVPGEDWESLEPLSREEFLARLPEAEQVLDAGAWFHYSNLAYALLGEVLERLAEMPYRRYVDERILRPLGLGRTTWEPEPEAARGYFVEPYSDAVRIQPAEVELAGSGASGQLWSTVGDLARWGAFLADPDPSVLTPVTAEEMATFQAMGDQVRWTFGWGLGLELDRRGERVWAGHGGAMPGFLAYFGFRREEKLGAAVLVNSGAGADPTGLALSLAEKALELEPAAARAWSPASEPPAEVAGMLGRWWSEGEEFVFRYRGGTLQARLARAPDWRPPAVFEPEGDDRWRTVSGRERGELLTVVRDGDGTPVKLYWASYPFTREPRAF